MTHDHRHTPPRNDGLADASSATSTPDDPTEEAGTTDTHLLDLPPAPPLSSPSPSARAPPIPQARPQPSRSSSGRSNWEQLNVANGGWVNTSKVFEVLRGQCYLSDDELRALIEQVDSDSDQYLSIDEFSKLLSKITRPGGVELSIEKLPKVWLQGLFESGDVDDGGTKEAKTSKPSIPILESLLSGGLAGAMAKTFIAPADRVKILYQVSSTRRFSLRSAWKSAMKILQNEGLFGLWKGHSATLIRVIPHAAIMFLAFDSYEKLFVSFRGQEMDVFTRFWCGALAGVSATMCTFPLDLIRARMACQWGHQRAYVHSSYRRFIRKIFREEGFAGFYKGLNPTLLGHIPYAGLSFALFETLKKYALTRFKTSDDQFQTVPRLACGGLAGVLAQSATYPLDIVRRRMQVDSARSHMRRYRSTWHALSHIYSTEGLIAGLYKGLSMNWIKGPIAVSVSFTVHDYAKHYFVRRHRQGVPWIYDSLRDNFTRTFRDSDSSWEDDT